MEKSTGGILHNLPGYGANLYYTVAVRQFLDEELTGMACQITLYSLYKTKTDDVEWRQLSVTQ